jgi:ketosteroid isomerase-like protein
MGVPQILTGEPLRGDTLWVSQANVDLMRRFWERFLGTGEVPWDLVDDRIEVHDHDTPDQGVYRERAGVERWLQDWSDAWADWSSEPEEFIDAGDAVVVVVRMHAQGSGSGLELSRQDAVVYRFQDDKIARADYYNSKDQALEDAGFGLGS